MKRFPVYFLFFALSAIYAQDTVPTAASRYLEDQFYAGITYNLLLARPDSVSQNNFSNGIQLGFIKDIPLNTRRNTGLGIGLGYAVDSYYTNLRASAAAGAVSYEILTDAVSYRRNKIEAHLVEAPVEFRWRTSTANTYKFWRIYTGIKLGYVFANTSKYVTNDQKEKFSNPDIRRFQYGIYLSFGYNTWNFYVNYQLTPLFKEGVFTVTGDEVKTRALKIGLIFYIL
ncbi:MAG: PorT family protein [Sinomicrobium sp.]|nr:PorT family protein [Sinomicrobium sp.]